MSTLSRRARFFSATVMTLVEEVFEGIEQRSMVGREAFGHESRTGAARPRDLAVSRLGAWGEPAVVMRTPPRLHAETLL